MDVFEAHDQHLKECGVSDGLHYFVRLVDGSTLRGCVRHGPAGFIAIATRFNYEGGGGDDWSSAWVVPLSSIIAIRADFDVGYSG